MEKKCQMVAIVPTRDKCRGRQFTIVGVVEVSLELSNDDVGRAILTE